MGLEITIFKNKNDDYGKHICELRYPYSLLNELQKINGGFYANPFECYLTKKELKKAIKKTLKQKDIRQRYKLENVLKYIKDNQYKKYYIWKC